MRAMGRRSVSSFLAGLLNVAWYAVALALALTALLVVLSTFVEVPGLSLSLDVTPGGGVNFETTPPVERRGLRMTIPVSFTMDPRKHRVTAPSLGIEDAQIRGVRGSLRFPARRGLFFTGNAILLIILGVLGLSVLGLLRAVFRTLRDGQPFVPANATRIRWIAFAGIVFELTRSAIVFFENYYAMTYFSADGLSFDARPDFNVLAIINGLIILVIAEVFRAGTRLDEEQSLTV